MRLRDYDYAQAGAYFVTVCTSQRKCLLGDIVNDVMQCNAHGMMVQACWEELPRHYGHVTLDEFVVMPNHVHGIIVIEHRNVAIDSVGLGVGAGLRPAPTNRHALPEIVRAFKSYSSRRINESRNTVGSAVWQRNYFERVIRNERELNAFRKYIQDNPIQWALDAENPLRAIKDPR